MKKIKKTIDLFKMDKIQLIRRINTLSLENETLKSAVKDELYKIFMDKLKESQELDRIKKENKMLKNKVKTLKQLLKGDSDAR